MRGRADGGGSFKCMCWEDMDPAATAMSPTIEYQRQESIESCLRYRTVTHEYPMRKISGDPHFSFVNLAFRCQAADRSVKSAKTHSHLAEVPRQSNRSTESSLRRTHSVGTVSQCGPRTDSLIERNASLETAALDVLSGMLRPTMHFTVHSAGDVESANFKAAA